MQHRNKRSKLTHKSIKDTKPKQTHKNEILNLNQHTDLRTVQVCV